MKQAFIRGRFAPLLPAVIILSCLYVNNAFADTAGFQHSDTAGLRHSDTAEPKHADTGFLKKPQLLHEAVVTGRLPYIQRTLDRTVINVESHIAAAGSNVWDLMRKLPGVQVDQDGQINLNGKPGVTVYIDGRASYLSAGDLAALLKGMSAEDIKKIELIAHPSAKYDAAGSGGIINIIRKKNRRPGWNGNLHSNWEQCEYPAFGLGGDVNYHQGPLSCNLLLNGSGDRQRSGSLQRNDLYEDHLPVSSQVHRMNDLNTNHSSSLVFSGDLDLNDRNTLSLTVTRNANTHENNLDDWQDQYAATGGKSGALDFSDLNKGHSGSIDAALRYVHKLDTIGQELSGEISYGHYPGQSLQHMRYGSYDAEGHDAGDSLSLMDRRRGLSVWVGRVDYTLPVSASIQLEAGWKSSYVINRVRQQYDGDLSERQVTMENINALYGTIERRWTKWSIKAGIRMEQSRIHGQSVDTLGAGSGLTRTYWLFFPSLSAEYRIDSLNRIGIQVSRRVQRPGYNLLNPLHDPMSATSWFQGNPALQPQLNNDLELSYTYRDAVTLTLGTLIYQHFYRTFTFPDSDGISTYRMPAAIRKAWGLYGELNWSQRLTPWWEVNLFVFTYQRWFDGFLGTVRPVVSPVFTCNFTFEHAFTLGKGWTAECTNIFSSTRQVISARLGPTNNLSLGLRRRFWDGRASCSIEANNIFQTEGYAFREVTDALVVQGRQFMYSRSINLSCSYRFGRKDGPKKLRRPHGSSEERRE